jgi:hypothetical protein
MNDRFNFKRKHHAENYQLKSEFIKPIVFSEEYSIHPESYKFLK